MGCLLPRQQRGVTPRKEQTRRWRVIPLAVGVTLLKGAAPASEGDSRVREKAEPGDAAYVAAENVVIVGNGDVMVPLAPPTESSQRHPSGGEGHGGGNGPGAGERPLAAGVIPPEGATLALEGDPGVREAGRARRCCFCSHGELSYGRKRGGDGAGAFAPALTQSSIPQQHLERLHRCPRRRGWWEHKRQTRSSARGSGRGSQATRTGRGAATNRERIPRRGRGETRQGAGAASLRSKGVHNPP